MATQGKLEIAYEAMEAFSEVLDQLSPEDHRYIEGIELLSRNLNKLAEAYSYLVIRKAQAGVIGISWYKQNEQD